MFQGIENRPQDYPLQGSRSLKLVILRLVLDLLKHSPKMVEQADPSSSQTRGLVCLSKERCNMIQSDGLSLEK